MPVLTPSKLLMPSNIVCMHMHCIYLQKFIGMEIVLIPVMAERQVRADSFSSPQHVLCLWLYSTEIMNQNGLHQCSCQHCNLKKEAEVIVLVQAARKQRSKRQYGKGLFGGEGKQF